MNMLTRRRVVGAGAAAVGASWFKPAAAAASLPVPATDSIRCRVLRKGEDIGIAAYRFEQAGDVLRVHIAIDLQVKLGPISLFRYSHRNVETWQGNNLVGFEAKTDDDGTPKFMSAKKGPDGLQVTGSKTKPYTAPPGALGTTYWNVHCVSSPLINTEDGHLMDVKIAPAGTSSVPLASGAAVAAREYAMRGEVKIDLWYEPSDAFVSLRYFAKDGSVVTYERL
jgi:hypothetical protein